MKTMDETAFVEAVANCDEPSDLAHLVFHEIEDTGGMLPMYAAQNIEALRRAFIRLCEMVQAQKTLNNIRDGWKE